MNEGRMTMNETGVTRLVGSDSLDGEDFGERSLRPKLFHEVIGQKELVDNLKVFVQAAKERSRLSTMSCWLVHRDLEKLRLPMFWLTSWE